MSKKREHTPDKCVNSKNKLKRNDIDTINVEMTDTLLNNKVKENLKKAFLEKCSYSEGMAHS